MPEIGTFGSEGGGIEANRYSLPLFSPLLNLTNLILKGSTQHAKLPAH
jgi:hypothetical protein